MAGRSHSLNKALRRRITGLVGAVIGSGSQRVRALLVAVGGCLAGSAWGQSLIDEAVGANSTYAYISRRPFGSGTGWPNSR